MVGVDRDGVIRHVSSELDGRFGIAAADAVGRSFLEFVDTEDAHQAVESFGGVMERRGHHQALEVRLVTSDGERTAVDVVAENRLDDPTTCLVLLNIGDRADRRRSVQLLDSQAEVVRQIALGGTLEVAIEEILRFVEHALPGFRAAAYFLDDLERGAATAAPSLPSDFTDHMARHIRTTPDLPGAMALSEQETIVVSDVRESHWQAAAAVVGSRAMSIWSVPIRYDRGAPCLGCVEIYGPHAAHPRDEDWTILQLVSRQAAVAFDRINMQQRLVRDAEIDPLTGTPNRRLLETMLTSILERPERGQVVCFIDLDRLKVVNDGLGHEAGDQVIRDAARRLCEQTEGLAIVGRFGGDEFVAISRGRDIAHHHLADRCMSAFDAPVQVGGRRWHLSASIGVVVVDGQRTSGEVLRDADAAMYEAKRAGRGRWQLFDTTTRETVVRRMALEQRLPRAIERSEIEAWFQPVVSASTWAMCGLEALARWRPGGGSPVTPHELIPLVEELGLIDQLGRQMIDHALTIAAELRTAIGPFEVSVNVSPVQLQSNALFECLAAARDDGLPVGSLCLEMTEQHMIDDTEQTLGQLERLIEVGVSLAVDDFGTGYSSLGALHRLPARTLKIDRRLVSQVGEPTGDAVVAAVIGVARAYRMSTVAEGVETPAQALRLRELGVDSLQGFLFARPMRRFEVLRRATRSGWQWDVDREQLRAVSAEPELDGWRNASDAHERAVVELRRQPRGVERGRVGDVVVPAEPGELSPRR